MKKMDDVEWRRNAQKEPALKFLWIEFYSMEDAND